MPKKSQSPTFTGAIAAQASVRVSHKDGALVLTLDESLAVRLGHSEESLSATTVELGDGRAVLLIASEKEDGPILVTRRGEAIEVCAPNATDGVDDDFVVDDVTEAFLLLKQRLYERGELELLGPLSAEDFLALGAERFEAIERRLRK